MDVRPERGSASGRRSNMRHDDEALRALSSAGEGLTQVVGSRAARGGCGYRTSPRSPLQDFARVLDGFAVGLGSLARCGRATASRLVKIGVPKRCRTVAALVVRVAA